MVWEVRICSFESEMVRILSYIFDLIFVLMFVVGVLCCLLWGFFEYIEFVWECVGIINCKSCWSLCGFG